MEALASALNKPTSAESIFCLEKQVIEQAIESPRLFYRDKENVVVLSGSSLASNFAEKIDHVNLKDLAFSSFIESRIAYLTSLNSLGDDWISGRSFQPSEKTIKLGIELLDLLKEWYSYNKVYNLTPPYVIMSPIPSGGIGFEITTPSLSRIFLNIFNDGSINFEVETNGYYQEIEANVSSYKEQLSYFLSIRPGWNDSGWSNDSGWTSSLPVC